MPVNIRDEWKALWNDKANSSNMFDQIGRSSYTAYEFFIMMKELDHELNVKKTDCLLDAGGGIGWTSMYFSPFVKEIVLFDYSKNMVSKSKELTSAFENITAVQDDILLMSNVRDKEYNKVIVGSVLQYMENMNQIEKVLNNLYEVMSQGSKSVLIHNPDIKKKETHIKSYEKLDWPKEKIIHSLEMEEKRLWLNIDEIIDISNSIGFSKLS